MQGPAITQSTVRKIGHGHTLRRGIPVEMGALEIAEIDSLVRRLERGGTDAKADLLQEQRIQLFEGSTGPFVF